ncbi:MAG: DUF3817 domain-containing protein [Chloroflexales bacterium]|nr:DUF3817 domain-containing protein [Chloroflexales bacterium]
MLSLPPPQRALRRLNRVRWIALADAILLVALVAASLSGRRDLVRILGPLHGGNFLLLLTVVATAALDGLWSWWFPLGVLLTGGPLGALVGEWSIRRRIAARADAANAPVQETAQ